MARTVLFISFLLYSISIFAFDVSVNPVILKLGRNQQALSFTVKNKSDSKIIIQLIPVKWIDNNGDISDISTNDLIVTPPIVTIEQGAEQIVRVGLRKPEVPYTEKTYRIILQEVPIFDLDNDDESETSLKMVFKFILPLFISPLKENRVVNWEVKKISPKKLLIRLVNRGNVHVTITNLVLQDANSVPISFSPQVAGRVLSGQSQEWQLSLNKILTGKRIALKAATDWEGKDRELKGVLPIK